jgi:hypothetical protein
VVSQDLKLDARMFAIRSAKHVSGECNEKLDKKTYCSKKVFEFMWRLVCHDIWFLWDRIDYLTNQDDQVLAKVPFTVWVCYFYILKPLYLCCFQWIPASPPDPANQLKKDHKVKVSLLSGFAMAPAVKEVVDGGLKKVSKTPNVKAVHSISINFQGRQTRRI